ncbi:unnamed protein product [Candidula unifasciata]|uniref:Uncharacterized protein n=1 Tax=Candidula unifasciata TaxID=100452 RepID=A0A8S3Z629_9EUPU|nr:unnamed protein product [Candidula unifasciata]
MMFKWNGLLAALLLCVITVVTSEDASKGCGFSYCATNGQYKHLRNVEKYLLFLNTSRKVKVNKKGCDGFTKNLQKCNGEKKDCPTALQLKWKHRFLDDFFVDYFTKFGEHACKNMKSATQLNKCMKPEFPAAAAACIQEKVKFDTKCLLDAYTANKKCSKAVDIFVADLIENYIAKYPYTTAD